MDNTKKTIFSGIQPTAIPQLGNYLGALKNWAKLQDEYNGIYCVVDMHSITVRREPQVLRKTARDVLTLLIAIGIDPEKSLLYYQSHVPEHAQLAWVLNCYTYIGELNRMTQFKEKSQKNESNINAGLFTYPVLMAADILLYQSNLVPVGEDQKQHLEIARDIAERFNNTYSETFTLPEPYITKVGGRIMGLQEPNAKMSKSETDNDNNVVFLLEDPNVIMKKFKRAVTDSGSDIIYSDDKSGIKNLLEIYSIIKQKTIPECEKEFSGVGYGEFKTTVGEAVISELLPIQEKFKELSMNKDYVDKIIKNNSEKARYLAQKTLRKVYKKIGFPV